MSTMESRVEAGAKLLDEKDPWWASKVYSAASNDCLDMDSCRDCVLGIAFGNYGKGLKILGIRGGQNHGFDINSDDVAYDEEPEEYQNLIESAYRRLESLWAVQIKARTEGSPA